MTTNLTIDKDVWNHLIAGVESRAKEEVQKKNNKAVEQFKGKTVQPWVEKIGAKTLRFYPPRRTHSLASEGREYH